MSCINRNNTEYKALLDEALGLGITELELLTRVSLWQEANQTDEFPSIDQVQDPIMYASELSQDSPVVSYNFKTVNTITNNLSKIQSWEKNKSIKPEDLWNKIQQLGIPKEQIALLKESKGSSIEEKLVNFIANYSYAIEINTAKEKLQSPSDIYNFNLDGNNYSMSYYQGVEEDYIVYLKNDEEISYEEYNEAQNKYLKIFQKSTPTQHYSNLTVPGGTNYTEQEIATPAITPSIKGHAQFATPNGIGWFRSDEQLLKEDITGYEETYDLPFANEDKVLGTPSTKTRRILEVQSDLFQKGRDKALLIDSPIQKSKETEFGENRYIDQEENGNYVIVTNYIDRQEISNEFFTIEEAQNELNKLTNTEGKEVQSSTQNQFLQLLNKDNNWVAFFIKSIIQDSAKKGYEKVLFPTGNTASKVEGHTTLEEFKREKEARIKNLETVTYKKFNNKQEAVDFRNIGSNEYIYSIPYQENGVWQIASIDNVREIETLKQELERVEGPEGFGALKPIYNFYENTVANILNKQYGKDNVKLTTDEYGNTWNEITIKPEFQAPILFQLNTPSLTDTQVKMLNMNQAGFMSKQIHASDIRKVLGSNANLYTIHEAVNGAKYLKDLSGKIVKPPKGMRQMSSEETRDPSPALEAKMKKLLAALGVKYEAVSQINDAQGNPISAIAAARMLERVVQVIEGKAKIDTLPEEAAHFFIKALGKNHVLYQAMKRVAESDPMLQTVTEEYGEVYNMNQDMLVEETMGKLLAKAVVGQASKEQVKNLWERIWTWIKNLFGDTPSSVITSDINAYEKAAKMMLEADTNGLNTLIYDETGGELMFQLSSAEVNQVMSKLEADQAKIKLTEDGKYYVYTSETGEEIYFDRVSSKLPNEFEGDTTKYEGSRIVGNTVDTLVRDFFQNKALTRPESMSPNAFQALQTRLNELKAEMTSKGEKFLTNNIILFDPELKIAGEVDILVLTKDNTFKIYDVKTMTPKTHEKYDKTRKNKHSLQLSAYANLFINRYGVQVEKLGVIPFAVEYTESGEIKKLEAKEFIPINYNMGVNKYVKISDRYSSVLDNPYRAQIVFVKRAINRLKKQQKQYRKESDNYIKIGDKISALEKQLDDAIYENEKQKYVDMGNKILEDYIDRTRKRLAAGGKLESVDIEVIEDLIEAWSILKETQPAAMTLQELVYPEIYKDGYQSIVQHSTEKGPPTMEAVVSQNQDINAAEMAFSSLSDSGNYIARTVGAMITKSQNEASREDRIFMTKLSPLFDNLMDWAQSNGFNEETIWDLFLVEKNGTWVMASPKESEQLAKIMDHAPLREFYSFYISSMQDAMAMGIPNMITEFHVPNIRNPKSLKESFKGFKDKFDSDNDTEDTYTGTRRGDLDKDIVPAKYTKKLGTEEKSKHLAESLYIFMSYSHKYNHMQATLPKVRVLQKMVAKQIKNGVLDDRQFKKSSDPKTTISGKETNLYKMIDQVIKMQIMGELKNDKEYQISKNLRVNDVIDFSLQYNSLLKIGLSPITATANVVFGELSNLIEGFGGRFYTASNLHSATTIYNKEFLRFSTPENMSEVQELFLVLNPLQEITDYAEFEKVTTKKGLTRDKVMSNMYVLQKAGEHWLQTRTMLAVAIKDGYLNSDGTLTDKGKVLLHRTESGEYNNYDAIDKLSGKIHRVNQMIHGRYTSREAATLYQHSWYRAVSQFKKWLPTAIENRFVGRRYDNRLGVEIEGRYRTALRMSGMNPITLAKTLLSTLRSYEAMVESGKMTELDYYNMRKNLIEIILVTALMTLAAGIKDDEEKWKKDPMKKTIITLLNRASSDLYYFMTPKPLTELTVPLSGTIKQVTQAVAAVPTIFTGEIKSSGQYKGWNNATAEFMDIIPGAKPLKDVMGLLNQNTLQEF